MIVLDYQKKYHRQIIRTCVNALKKGKAVVFPTDTSYGLAVDATKISAIKNLYKIKGRDFNKPVHVVVPSVGYARRLVKWNGAASKLTKKFWPGALTIVLGLRAKGQALSRLSAGTGFLGVRAPKNKIALDLSKILKRPITATSANRSGKPDCYSVDEVISQFKKSKYKPDIIINAGKLKHRKPSTVVKIDDNQLEILRPGPISKKQISPGLSVEG
jgi:L-threonylcarbamoyladenylate synthase